MECLEDRRVATLEDHMNVVGHPAIKVKACRIPRHRYGQKALPTIAIVVVVKDRLLAIAAERHVIERVRSVRGRRRMAATISWPEHDRSGAGGSCANGVRRR